MIRNFTFFQLEKQRYREQIIKDIEDNIAKAKESLIQNDPCMARTYLVFADDIMEKNNVNKKSYAVETEMISEQARIMIRSKGFDK